MSRSLRLVNQSSHADAPVDLITVALTRQLHQVAAAWGEYVYHISDAAAAAGFKLVLLDNADQAGALGYHDVDPNGEPYARIFVDTVLNNGGTWTEGSLSVSAVCSHEMCELLGDPGANRWANDAQGVLWALELCDAVESDSYPILTNGKAVSVSNFVYPSYFNPFGVAPFDHEGTISEPMTVAPGGYAIRMTAGKVTQVFGAEYLDWRKATKSTGSRTSARLTWEI